MAGEGLLEPPLVKHSLSTFLGSNEMVTHLGHGNGGSHDVKGSKNVFRCERDSRMTQNFEFFQKL